MKKPLDAPSYHCFATAIGPCGIAWQGDAVQRVYFPEAGAARGAEDNARGRAAAPPAAIRGVIVRLVAALAGRPVALHEAALDLTAVPPFHRRVYQAAQQIPWGQTVTYGELAARAGAPGAARAVGQAMARNPFPLLVPCHRVVAAGRRLGGFTAPQGAALKRRLLANEGVGL